MKPDAHHLLLDLYAEWHRLTDIEGAAIGKDEWSSVEQQQLLKRKLQDQIVQTAEQWHAEQGDTEATRARYEREFRSIVTSLVQQESQNHELLCHRRQYLQSSLAALNQSGIRLRGIHRTYAAEGGSSWQSYS